MKMFEDRIIIDPEIRHGKPVIKTELADSRTKVLLLLLYIYIQKDRDNTRAKTILS